MSTRGSRVRRAWVVEGRSATYTTEKMFLEVKLSGTWALSFDDFEDLRRKASVNTGSFLPFDEGVYLYCFCHYLFHLSV